MKKKLVFFLIFCFLATSIFAGDTDWLLFTGVGLLGVGTGTMGLAALLSELGTIDNGGPMFISGGVMVGTGLIALVIWLILPDDEDASSKKKTSLRSNSVPALVLNHLDFRTNGKQTYIGTRFSF